MNLNGSVDDELMELLVHDFCVSSLCPQPEEPDSDNRVSEDESDEEDEVTEAPDDDLAPHLLGSKRKLKFSSYDLWKEARNTVQDWHRAFREEPDLFLTPRQVKELLATSSS